MHIQRDLFSPMLARSFHRQGELFDQSAATEADSNLRCSVCQSFLVRTGSDYLCCPRGHGKLITEAVADDEPADHADGQYAPYEPIPWDVAARRTARRHARRQRWLHDPQPCGCGACRHARALDAPPRPAWTAVPSRNGHCTPPTP
jgi:hypothetical protein